MVIDVGVMVSDEVMVMELVGYFLLLVEGVEDNIKVIMVVDFVLVEFLLVRMV